MHSIQSLLSAIRSGSQGPQLDENLSEIINIVSSVVSISRENLPPSRQADGFETLDDLATNCNKLSELQGDGAVQSFNKQTKQAVASASFAIARSLKQLKCVAHGYNFSHF